MSNKTKILFIIIVILILIAVGVFAGFNLIQRFQTNQGPEVAEEVTVKANVVVVKRDLALGDTISANDVELVSVPVEMAPRNSIGNTDEVIGRFIKTDLVQGEMVLMHNLADPTNKNKDLSFILGDDHVLMAFPASDLLSRENMVQRGDIIDIFATFTQKVKTVGEEVTAAGETKEPQLRTFTIDSLQKVDVTALVLEVIEDESNTTPLEGQNNENAPRKSTRIRAYLLALNPQDALILKHLKDTESIFDIVLRSPTSTVPFDLTPVTEEYIIEFYGLEILP